MDILIKVLGIFMLSLAAILVVGFIFKAFGKEPELRTMFSVAIGIPIGHLLSDMFSLDGAMHYIAIGGCTAASIAIIDTAFRRRRPDA